MLAFEIVALAPPASFNATDNDGVVNAPVTEMLPVAALSDTEDAFNILAIVIVLEPLFVESEEVRLTAPSSVELSAFVAMVPVLLAVSAIPCVKVLMFRFGAASVKSTEIPLVCVELPDI